MGRRYRVSALVYVSFGTRGIGRVWNGEEEDVVRGQLLGVKPDIKLNRERVPQ